MSEQEPAAAPAAQNRFQLEAGPPLARVVAKIRDEMDDWLLGFIRQSPFMVLATADAKGGCDVSPRGGEPGFVRVVGRRQLVLPDQPGNNLFQSFANLDANPGMALLFLIPGVPEMARVNGDGRVLSRSELADELGREVVEDLGGASALVRAVLVQVREAYYHCGRAARFGGLWDTERIAANRADRPVPKRPPRREAER